MPSPKEHLGLVCRAPLQHDDSIDQRKESSHGKSIQSSHCGSGLLCGWTVALASIRHTFHIGDTKMIANMVVVFGSGGGIYISGGFVLVILLVVVVMKLL